ncbi:serine protease [Streptomyces caniscabiei]|uniref:trypsin-like serine peptidase n=1 Tax=Streptomyces caniscabiei TaxID=2746961 RepID=UPI001CE227D1|nr:serine protease [Streptomyces caniscabiei]MDX3513436.1 serine protease [Streptomyces caniscabiei]MDX3722430.1 serine protease [Streptomyces caniscabiei]WEO27448.1 serine protease [Streptomyces caniscabiei]
MDPQRLVWVRTDDPDGCGSGYLIGPQLVLTALHVVLAEGRWAGRVAARVGHPRYGAGLVDRSAQVCWPDPRQGIPPADALDVALLWLEAPVLGGGDPVRWGRPGGVEPVPFVGAGFPAFAADTDNPAHFEYIHGDLPDVSTSSSGWVLNCPVWPAPGHRGERPWEGASGSAVFCHGRLVGVVTEDNRAVGYRRLHAVPVHEALGLPGFADHVTRHGFPGTTTVVDEVTAATGKTAGRSEEATPPAPSPAPTGEAARMAGLVRDYLRSRPEVSGLYVVRDVSWKGKVQRAHGAHRLDDGEELVAVWVWSSWPFGPLDNLALTSTGLRVSDNGTRLSIPYEEFGQYTFKSGYQWDASPYGYDDPSWWLVISGPQSWTSKPQAHSAPEKVAERLRHIQTLVADARPKAP